MVWPVLTIQRRTVERVVNSEKYGGPSFEYKSEVLLPSSISENKWMCIWADAQFSTGPNLHLFDNNDQPSRLICRNHDHHQDASIESHRNYGWISWRVRLNYPVYYPISLSSSWHSSHVRIFLCVTYPDNGVFDCGRWRNRHSRQGDISSGKDDTCAIMKNCVQRRLVMIQLSAVV
jgi:hypothetical protein